MKRAVDLTGSLIALVLLSPLFLGVALTIKLTSKGPVFCRRKRIGQYGVPFVFFEFRSICLVDGLSKYQEYVRKLIADKAREGQIPSAEAKAFFKLTSHPEVTRVGSFLRQTSLDALPEFFNVLKGEMSLVGPRPFSPWQLGPYDFCERSQFEAKPGIIDKRYLDIGWVRIRRLFAREQPLR